MDGWTDRGWMDGRLDCGFELGRLEKTSLAASCYFVAVVVVLVLVIVVFLRKAKQKKSPKNEFRSAP